MRKRSRVAMVDQAGQVVKNRKVISGVEPILSLIGEYPTHTTMAFEAAYGWVCLVELLKRLRLPAALVYPTRCKMIAPARLRNAHRCAVETQLHYGHAYGPCWSDAFLLVHDAKPHALPERQATHVALVHPSAGRKRRPRPLNQCGYRFPAGAVPLLQLVYVEQATPRHVSRGCSSRTSTHPMTRRRSLLPRSTSGSLSGAQPRHREVAFQHVPVEPSSTVGTLDCVKSGFDKR